MRSVTLVLRLPRGVDCPLTKSDDLAEALSEMAGCLTGYEEGVEDFVDMKGDTCNSCDVVRQSRCYIGSAGFRMDGVMEWTVMVPDSAALEALVRGTTGRGCAVVIQEVAVMRTAKELTKDQEDVLQLALDMGYFDVPRKVTAKVLARRLNMTASSLEIVLHRAERKVLADRMGRK